MQVNICLPTHLPRRHQPSVAGCGEAPYACSASFRKEFFSETSKSKWAQEEARVLPAPTLFLSCSILRYRLPLIVRGIMMSLFRSLVPVREMGKGKGGGHQDISCIPTAYMF